MTLSLAQSSQNEQRFEEIEPTYPPKKRGKFIKLTTY